MNLKNLKDLDKDEILKLVGLQTRSSASDFILPSIGIFAVGVLVGVGMGLLLAPRPGSELREELRETIRGGADALGGSYSPESGVASERRDRP
jgi:hypothetical protein